MRRRKIERGSGPDIELLRNEKSRLDERKRFKTLLINTCVSLIVVAAIAVLIATIWVPVLEITGTSMEPTLHEGEVVICVKANDFTRGDLMAFYYGNKLIIKRCIAVGGESIYIDDKGNVTVNGKKISEPYVKEKAFGESNIHYPFTVGENMYFVLGDHRSVSKDSRVSQFGCIEKEQLLGKVVFRIWPLSKLGKVE